MTAALLLLPVAGRAQSIPAWAPTLDSVVTAALATSRAPGATVAVVHNGRLVYTKGYGLANVETRLPMEAGMLLRVGSVTKMFTGALLASLAEKGQLDMQQPIGTYVTSLAGKRVGTVTTHQLMTHSAGWIDNAVAYGRMGEGALGEVMREVGDTLFFTDAGRTFSYSNPSISMAGYVAEVAGKQRYASLVESLVMRPTGMSRSTFKPLEALTWPIAMGHLVAGANNPPTIVRPFTENTAQWASGFLLSSAPELARFAMAVMNDGELDGARVFPQGVIRRLTTGYVPHPGGSGLDSAMYAYGLVVGRTALFGRPERVWTHGGSINGYNADVYMLPDRKTAVVTLVNGPGSGIAGIRLKALELALGTAPQGRPVTATRELTAAERAQLVGRYAMGRRVVEVREAEGGLVLVQDGMSVPLLRGGDNEIVGRAPATVRMHTRVENGRVTYLYSGSRALARQP
ncbi:serine hydrolase domain-containing protein [Gemmatimonas sp.]|jgi:CubicO group peptidase (beta-lactamase class C family)